MVKYGRYGILWKCFLLKYGYGFSMPVIEKILEEIIDNGAPEEMALGYNRKKHDLIVARKKAYAESCSV